MKTRPEYVAICQTCLKGKFNSKKGLICSLTDEHAAFETEDCPDYEAEQKAIRRQEAQERRDAIAKEDQKGIFSGKAGFFGGIIMVVFGIISLILGIVFMEVMLFIYAIILIIGGVISISKGIDKKKLYTRVENSTVIDDNLNELI